jgi:hypothetical protein
MSLHGRSGLGHMVTPCPSVSAVATNQYVVTEGYCRGLLFESSGTALGNYGLSLLPYTQCFVTSCARACFADI